MAEDFKPLNKNLVEGSLPSLKERSETPYEGTVGGSDVSSFSKKDLGGRSLEDFQKETGTGGSVLTKQNVQDYGFWGDLQKEHAKVENDIKALQQGVGEKIWNGTVKLGGRVFTSVVGSTIGTLYGLYAWARDGEFRAFYDNEFQDGLDGINDYLAEEFKHYYTSDPNDWEVGNFIFDKVFDGLGFAIGAVASGMIGSGTVGAITKALGWSNKLKAGAVKSLKQLHNSNASINKKLLGEVTTAKYINRVENLMEKLPQTVTSMTTGAVYESGVEARHTFDEIKESLITSYTEKNGKAPTGEDLIEINKLAGESANGVFAANMVLVGGSNFLQFGKHLGLDYRDVTRMFSKTAIAKKVTEEGTEQFVRKGSKVLRGTKAVLSKPFIESQEEMLQSVFSNTGKEYALTKYDNKGKADILDLVDASLKSFKKVYSSSEGWEEGFIGAIIGGLGVPVIGKKSSGKTGLMLAGGIKESITELRADEAFKAGLIEHLNNTDAITSLTSAATHSIRDGQLERGKDGALLLGDEYMYKNLQDDQFFSYISSRIQAGMFELVSEDLQHLKTIPLEDYKKTFGINEEIKFTEADRIKQLESFERRANTIKESIDFIERLYSKLDVDTQERLAYNHAMLSRIEERKESIAQELDKITDSYFSTNLKPINQLENGERLTAQQVFKDLPDKITLYKDQYIPLYEDYVKLEERATSLLEDWQSVFTDEGQKEFAQAIKDIQKEVVKTQTKKEESKKQEEKEKRGKQISEEKQKVDEREKELDSLLSKGDINLDPDGYDTIALDKDIREQLIDNINNVTDINALKTLLDIAGVEINRLPQVVRQAVQNKLNTFKEESKKIKTQKQDPTGIDSETEKNSITDYNLEEEVNDTKDDTAPPRDLTLNTEEQNEVENEIEKSNRGEVLEGYENEEVQESTKGHVTNKGLLVDGFNAVSTNDREYIEDKEGIKNATDNLSENANGFVHSSEHLIPGEHSVEIRAYEGRIIGDKTNEVGVNQILEVVYNDEVIGYIHDENFIEDRVAPSIKDRKDNIEFNKTELAKFRKAVYEKLQRKETVFVKVLSKTSGHLFIKTNQKYDTPISKIIKGDKRPKLLKVTSTGLYYGNTLLEDTEFGQNVVNNLDATFLDKYKGLTVIAVPGANGQYILSLVRTGSESESAYPIKETALEVIDAYVNSDYTTLEKYGLASVEDQELYTEEIQDFLENYFYASRKVEDPNYFWLGLDKQGNNTVKFKEETGKDTVRYNKNQKTIRKRLVNKLTDNLISVNLEKMYDPDATIVFNDGTEVNYTDFILENVYGNFLGHELKISETETVITYVANPVVHIDTGVVTQVGTTVSEKKTKRDKPEKAPKAEKTSSTEIETQKADVEQQKKTTKKPTKSIKNTALGKLKSKKGRKSPKRIDISRLTEGYNFIFDKNNNLLPSKDNRDIIKSLTATVRNIIKDNKDVTINDALDQLEQELELFRNTYKYFATKEDILAEDIEEGALPTVKENEIRAEIFDLVLSNFDKYTQNVFAELKNLGFKINKNRLIVKDPETIEQEDITLEAIEQVLEGNDPTLDKKSYEEGSYFQENPIDKISAEVKAVLDNIPTEEENILGIDSYYDLDTVYSTLLDLLSDQNYDTLEDFINILKSHTDVQPYIQHVIDYLEDPEVSVQDKARFNSHFKHAYVERVIVLHERKGNKNTFKPIRANRNNVAIALLDNWINNTGDTNIFKSVAGKDVINKEFIETKLTTLFNKAKESSGVADARRFLEAVGIKVSNKALEHLKKTAKNNKEFDKLSWEEHFTHSQGVFKVILNTLENASEEDSEHPLKTEGKLKKLAKLEARFAEHLTTNSSRNSEGKTLFNYVNTTWLKDRFTSIIKDGIPNLLTINKIKENAFSSSSTWLQKLVSKDEFFINNFKLETLDTLSSDSNKAETKAFNKLSKREKVITQLNLFINGQQGKSKTQVLGRFFIAKSDKHLLDIITVPRYNISSTRGQIKEGKFGKKDQDQLVNIARAEYARIIKAQHLRDSKKVDFKDIKDYNPFDFHLFPELNKLKDASGNLPKWDNTTREQILEILQPVIFQMEQATKEMLTSLGIISDNKLHNIDSSYIEQHGDNVDYFIRDYVLNYMIATVNYHQLFQGDVAITKGSFDSMFKRLAKDIAPSKRGAKFEGDPFKYNLYNQIVLKDAFNSSSNIEEIENKYGENSPITKAYKQLTGTDAQEVTTLAEHINVLFHYGKISDDQYRLLMRKAKKGATLSKEELEIVLQPMKPVYVTSHRFEDYGAELPVYIKSSSFPLVPQLIKGTEFEKLERIMRNNNIQRAVFESGVKLGAFKTIDAWNKVTDTEGNIVKYNDKAITDGTFNEELIEAAIKEGAFLTLNRDNFGIQQEIPFDPDKNSILEGTQLMKLILMGIKDPAKIKKFNNLHIELTDKKLKNFLEELGGKEKDGKIEVSDKVVAELLIDELIERGSFNINDIKALDIDPTTGKFVTPIWTTAKAPQYEALLNSIVTKRILSHKLPGKSYILGTEEGFKGYSPEITYVTKGLKGPAYNPNEGLKPQREGYYNEKTGKKLEVEEYNSLEDNSGFKKVVFPAQVLMVKGKFTNPQAVGYRIPTQGLNSMSAMEVVGYLPDYMADLIIAPKDFVAQMGSDFDIDKLYVHRWNEQRNGKKLSNDSTLIETAWEKYQSKREKQLDKFRTVKQLDSFVVDFLNDLFTTKDEQGNETSLLSIEITKEDIAEYYFKIVRNTLTKDEFFNIYNKRLVQNEIMDIYWDTLTDLENLPEIIKPLSLGNLEDAVKEILDANPQAIEEHHPLGPLYQIDNYENGNAGKFGVAVTSLASTSNALILATEDDIILNREVKVNDEISYTPALFKFRINGKIVSVSNIKGNLTLDGKTTKADVISAFQSASVDNIKELLIKIINYNKHTHDAFVTLAYLGLDDKYISYFLSQPIIREFVSERENISDMFSSVTSKQEETVYNNLIAKYLKTFSKDKEEQNKLFTEVSDSWNNPFSDEQLLFAARRGDVKSQLILLLKFRELSETGKNINELIRALQPATSGIGKNRLAANIRHDKAIGVMQSGAITGVEQLFGKLNDTKDSLETPTTIAGKGIEVLEITNKIFNSYFDINTVANRLGTMIAANKYSSIDTFTERERINFVKFIKSYIYSSNLTMYSGETIKDIRKRLLFGNNSLAHRWQEFKKTNPDNWLGKRIIVRTNHSTTIPNEIRYQASEAERTDDIHNTYSLIEMLRSGDELQYDLAKDTISYMYIVGGLQDAKSLLKFVPASYLEVANLGTDVNKTLAEISDAEINIAVKQYLQHHPYQAFSLTEDLNREGSGVVLENHILTVPKKRFFSNPPNFVTVKLENRWLLYERTDSESSDLAYKQVDLLGSRYSVETDFNNSDAKSDISENKVEKPITEGGLPIIKSSVDSIENSSKNVESNKELYLGYAVKDGSLKTILGKIAYRSDNPAFRKLAAMLLSSVGEVEVVVTDLSKLNADGVYDGTKISIDTNISDELTLLRTILHEAIHAAVSTTLEKPNNAQSKLKKSLEAVFNAAKRQYKGKNANAFTDLHEFVSELMTDHVFQKELEAIDFEKDKSFFTKIMEIINDILSLASELTIDNINNKVTIGAISDVIRLIDSVDTANTTSKATNDIVKKTLSAEEIAEIEFYEAMKKADEDKKEDDTNESMLKLSPKRNVQDAKIREKYFGEAGVTDAVTILNDISKSDHPLKELAGKLIKFAKESNIDLRLVDDIEPQRNVKNPSGLYIGNNILIKENAYFRGVGSEPTIIHEILHHLSHSQLKKNTEFSKVFNILYNKAKETIGSKYYAMSNPDEFLVGLFTDAKLIDALKDIEAIPGIKEYENLFEQIMEIILNMFGIFKSNNTLYQQAFSTATNILEIQRQENITKREFENSFNDIFNVMTDQEILEMIKNCE